MNISYRSFIIALFCLCQLSTSQRSSKLVAVTMDDLPLNIASKVNNTELRRVTVKLLGEITRAGAPVTAFVNEDKLVVNGRREDERAGILKLWLDANIDLGNHTFAHKSQNQVPVAEAKEDILKGERTIKELLAAKGKRPRYFRHPFLQTGRDSITRATLTSFLDSIGYTIAPVTIDNAEWIFSSAYDKAIVQNDSVKMESVAKEYILYMRSKVLFYEWMSDTLFGRQITQILLIHANRLNSDHYGTLLSMLKTEGYAFCTVEAALKDNAYRSRDTFYGGGGISWLDRWALTRGFRGKFFANDPHVPQSIMDYAGVKYE
ncbi:MAG: polysaccharide deacetylase family protein [Bacteroidetes bacterium]|nr:polysaccharide deacetylase family protein [Bacteroidota bacterium]